MQYSARNNMSLNDNITLLSPNPKIDEEGIRELHFSTSLTFFFLGVITNAFTLAIIKKYHNETEYHKDTILTMNLFINNLLASFLVTLFMAMDAKYLYPSHHKQITYISVCKSQLYLEYSIFGTEYLILIVIGMSRYFMINHHLLYQKIFGPQWNYRLILIACWTLCPLIFLYTLFLPVDEMTYSTLTSTCHYNGKEQDGFYFSIAIFLFTIPFILFTYIAICIKLFNVSSKLKSHRRQSMDFDKKEPLRERRLAMTAIVLFVKIFVTYLPHTLLIFIQPGNKNNPSMTKINIHIIFLYLRFSNMFTNAISYCFLNAIASTTLLKLWPFCHKKVHSNNSSSASSKHVNVSSSDVQRQEEQTSDKPPSVKIQIKPDIEVNVRTPSVEQNMRMSFSSNSIYIISTNSMDDDECAEMQCIPTSTNISTSSPDGNRQDILPSVQSTV